MTRRPIRKSERVQALEATLNQQYEIECPICAQWVTIAGQGESATISIHFQPNIRTANCPGGNQRWGPGQIQKHARKKQ